MRQKLSLNLSQMEACIYTWKKVYEVEFLRFVRDRKANNKYLKYYDPKQELKHIVYLDVNNSNSSAMSRFLSTSGFKWMVPKKFD